MARRRRLRGGYQLTTHLAVAFLLLFLFVGSAYLFILSGSDRAGKQHEIIEDLAASKQRWAENRPSTFEYVVVRSCDCPTEIRAAYNVREQHGSREAQFPIDIESMSGDMLSEPRSPVWLDDLFVIAEEALLNDHELSIRFDRRFGFVSSLTIDDGSEQDIRYIIRDFENLSP